jgi:hypothetical protein
MYDLKKQHFLPYSLWDATANNAEALRTQVSYKMIVGDADGQFQSNVTFRNRLLELGIDPQFQVLTGVGHVGGSYLSEGSGLRFLSEHFASSFRRGGDYDRDGDVDMGDFGVWRSGFGSSGDHAADGNEDGVVNSADYVIWRKHFNALEAVTGAGSAADGSNSTTVPETTAFGLTIIGAFGLAVAARRQFRLHGERASA